MWFIFCLKQQQESKMSLFLSLALFILCYVVYRIFWALPIIVHWCYARLLTVWKCLCGILYLIQRSREVTSNTGVKQLKRVHVHFLRRHTHDYLVRLEKGEGNAFVRTLFDKYVATVPEQYRATSNEGTSSHPLPMWLEQVIFYLDGDKTRRVLKFTVFYVVLLLSSHLWMPYVTSVTITMTPIEATRLALYTQLGIDIEPCMWGGGGGEESRNDCFLYTKEIANSSALVHVVMRDLIFKNHVPLNKTLDLLVDEGHTTLLYPLDLVVPLNRPVMVEAGVTEQDTRETMVARHYINVENDLIPLIMHIHNEEVASHPCICPLFLNIVSNLSFLYDSGESRWLVMANPTIYRNNSFAELVASNINYNKRSFFFNKYMRWQSLIPQELIHYDSFVVDYIEPVFSELVVTGSTTTTLNQPKELGVSLFSRVQTTTTLHKQVHLSGDNAVCFVYCDALSRGYAAAAAESAKSTKIKQTV